MGKDYCHLEKYSTRHKNSCFKEVHLFRFFLFGLERKLDLFLSSHLEVFKEKNPSSHSGLNKFSTKVSFNEKGKMHFRPSVFKVKYVFFQKTVTTNEKGVKNRNYSRKDFFIATK